MDRPGLFWRISQFSISEGKQMDQEQLSADLTLMDLLWEMLLDLQVTWLHSEVSENPHCKTQTLALNIFFSNFP